MVYICYSCGLDFLCLLLLNLIWHANNISNCKDLSDTKCMFAIRDNRKDQDKAVGHRRWMAGERLHLGCTPELGLSIFPLPCCGSWAQAVQIQGLK